MDKMLVVVFENEERAFQARQDLHELHRDGSIALYADAILAKDAEGVVHIRQAAEDGPIGMFIGMLTGGLVGALAGPAGMVIGMAGGTTVGAIRDLSLWGIEEEFINDVGVSLEPGKAAVVAELTEGWTLPLDVKMKDGIIIRRPRADIVAEQSDREIEALRADYEELKAEIKEARKENKIAVMRRMEKAKQALSAAADRAESRLETLKSTVDAKIATLKAQTKRSRSKARERYENRIAELEMDYQQRAEKLRQASRLAREALGQRPSSSQDASEQRADA